MYMPITATLIQQYSGRPILYDEVIYRGSSWQRRLQLADCNDIPYLLDEDVTALCQIRSEADVLIATIEATVSAVDRSVVVLNAGLAVTNTLPVPDLRAARNNVAYLGRWDVLLTDGVNTLPIVAGSMYMGRVWSGA